MVPWNNVNDSLRLLVMNNRNLDARTSAAYCGVSKSLFMQVYAYKLIQPVPMPGLRGTINKLLFDIRELDEMIDTIKEKRTCQSGTGREQVHSSSQKDTGIGTSGSNERAGRIRSSAPAKQRKHQQKESVDDTLQRWTGVSR